MMSFDTVAHARALDLSVRARLCQAGSPRWAVVPRVVQRQASNQDEAADPRSGRQAKVGNLFAPHNEKKTRETKKRGRPLSQNGYG